MSRRPLSFLAVCAALCALWAWGPGLFRSPISTEIHSKGDSAPARGGFPANVFLLSEGEHLEKDGVLVWWQGPEHEPRRFAIQDGSARVDLVDWAALNEHASSLTVELEQSFPASVLSCSVASGGASETRLLLELGKACALSIQAFDFDHQAIPHAKLELWGAIQSMGPALDCGENGIWEGTVFQADRLSLTVSAMGYAPIGMRFPRPAASRFSETVALPRIMAGGLVVDRRQNTQHHSFGYQGGSYDLAPWSEHSLRNAERDIKFDAENERVLWLTEHERYDRGAHLWHRTEAKAAGLGRNSSAQPAPANQLLPRGRHGTALVGRPQRGRLFDHQNATGAATAGRECLGARCLGRDAGTDRRVDVTTTQASLALRCIQAYTTTPTKIQATPRMLACRTSGSRKVAPKPMIAPPKKMIGGKGHQGVR